MCSFKKNYVIFGYAECCCTEAFSSHSMWASHCGGFSCCRAQALGTHGWTSIVEVHRLCWPVACEIFWTRDQTGVPCIARWILNHWTTREGPSIFLYTYLAFVYLLWWSTFGSFAHLLNSIFFSYYWVLSVLCVFGYKSSIRYAFANIFSQSVACLFILLTVSFTEQKF